MGEAWRRQLITTSSDEPAAARGCESGGVAAAVDTVCVVGECDQCGAAVARCVPVRLCGEVEQHVSVSAARARLHRVRRRRVGTRGVGAVVAPAALLHPGERRRVEAARTHGVAPLPRAAVHRTQLEVADRTHVAGELLHRPDAGQRVHLVTRRAVHARRAEGEQLRVPTALPALHELTRGRVLERAEVRLEKVVHDADLSGSRMGVENGQ